MSDPDTIASSAPTPNDGPPKRRIVSRQHRLEYLGYRILRVLIRALPFRAASNFSAFMWDKIAPRVNRHQRALNHLKLAYPDKTDQEREAIAREMWRNLGRTMAESFLLDRISAHPDMIEMQIDPEVQERIAQKKPMIITGLHLGNWEIAAIGASIQNVDLAGVYQRILNPLVDKAVTKTRRPLYALGLHPKGHDTVKAFMRFVRQGKSVGIISDLRDNRGLLVPFFGHPAKSSPFPALLSVMYDVPIVAVECIRLAPDRFRLIAQAIHAPDGKDRDETIYNRTAAIHAKFEEWIRQNPSQWMWAHRRWD